jgi:hypothetical protein
MDRNELANLIADFIMTSKEAVIEGIENDDISIVRDEAYEYLGDCID